MRGWAADQARDHSRTCRLKAHVMMGLINPMPRKLILQVKRFFMKSTLSFVADAIAIHGDKYNYSLVEYINNKTAVTIICPEHGLFKQAPNPHLRGSGCSVCGRIKANSKIRSCTTDFIVKARIKYGNKYDYSNVIYEGNKKKVSITCSKHGEFKQKPNSHLCGYGCPKCGQDRSYWNKLDTQEFLNKARIIHGNKYDYGQAVYIKSSEKVAIKCLLHGIFYQTPNAHLVGSGCPDCGDRIRHEKKVGTTEEFIYRAKIKHGDKYDYSSVNYVRARLKTEIICPTHGSFFQTPASHLSGQGCPICLESHGERYIAMLLNRHGIVYKREKTFIGCRNINKLRFDFYIPVLNMCIEYDGGQHYSPCAYFGGLSKFELQKKRDLIKTDFCFNNGIRLIRIPFKKIVVEVEDALINNGVI